MNELLRRRLMRGGKIFDAKIAYLHTGADNNNAISTGYKANNTDSFVLEVDLDKETGQGYESYMGSNGNLQAPMRQVPTGRHLLRVERSANNGPLLYVDNTLVSSSSYNTFIDYYIGIFALGTAANAARFGYYVKDIAVYSASLTINGDLVRDYIPVRVGQTGFLYDRVSNTLSGDVNGRAFVLGPDTV